MNRSAICTPGIFCAYHIDLTKCHTETLTFSLASTEGLLWMLA